MGDNNVATSPEGVSSGPKREKYWSELNDSEKIERTRQMIKSFSYSIERLENSIRKVERNFYDHQHDVRNGKMVKEIKENENWSNSFGLGGLAKQLNVQVSDDKVYF